TEAIKQLVAAGTALGCLSRRAVAQDVALGRLVELRTTLPRATRRLALVLRRGRATGRGTEAFIDYCREAAAGARK
ncbi:MAG: LysR substrate-binding domain-containing protein, partial [Vicinamibacterales bacterium]